MVAVLVASVTPPLSAQLALDERFACAAVRMQTGGGTNDHLGQSMSAGDWNGDGIDDLLIGSLPVTDPGEAWVFLGADPSESPPVLEIVGLSTATFIPPSVKFIGDIDDDGLDDIAVGATGYSTTAASEVGRLYMFSNRVSQ